MRRSEHYLEAERLTAQAVTLTGAATTQKYPLLREHGREDALFLLRAALIHATLAAAGPGVEQDVIDPPIAVRGL